MDSLIVGISGASGAVYGICALQLLHELGIKTHLVISKAAARTITEETNYAVEEIKALADYTYSQSDIGAAIASGSFRTGGMLVAPCSVKTASEIAYGNTSGLLTRAADVTLKERRRLVLLFRETPLHLGHLRMLTHLTEAGGIIMPPVPAFYAQPKTIESIVQHTIGRALDLFNLDSHAVYRWQGGNKKS